MNVLSGEIRPKATKILVIDDNALTRSLLRSILKADGYLAVREAGEADAGLKMALHFLPDVILLDVQMPGRSGLELLAELKAQTPWIPVLMVTASSDSATVSACLGAHANGFIVKPFSAAKVLKTIEGLLAVATKAPATV